MLGIILITIGTFFGEISQTIGKIKVQNCEESKFTMGFLTLFWGTVFFALIGIFSHSGFSFQSASLPTFITRAFLEIIQTYVTVLSIVESDRSTFGFVRTITIPLLVIVDIFLGYTVSVTAIVGICVIMIALLIIFASKGIQKKGIGLVAFSAVNAVATISLFKYNISHFNSVAAEQLCMYITLMVSFALFAVCRGRENPFAFLIKPAFFVQSFSVGIGSVIDSFAYNYGAASIITAAKRSASIFWSIVCGRIYFGEKRIFLKIAIFILMLSGLSLLSLHGG